MKLLFRETCIRSTIEYYPTDRLYTCVYHFV